MTGFGNFSVTTTNKTVPTVQQVGVGPERGGSTTHHSLATLSASFSTQGFDIFLSAVGGDSEPTVQARVLTGAIEESRVADVTEGPHVETTRQRYSMAANELLQATSRDTSTIVVEGSFVVSIWGWTFDVTDGAGQRTFFTGAEHRDPIQDPVTGMTLTYTDYEQVAQVIFSEGILEIGGVRDAQLNLFFIEAAIQGNGDLRLDQATGRLGSGSSSQLESVDVDVEGKYEVVARATDARPELDFLHLEGSANKAGQDIPLGTSGPIRNSATQVEQGRGPWSKYAPLLAVIGIMSTAILVKGPAGTARFNRIEANFEARDYAAVLRRIDPFTSKRRFRRRANFLKAISLLSLGNHREASLFLETLTARDGPDPATKAFLQACAAATRGDDAGTIAHLTACFAIDPDYKEEVAAVQALKPYLPYFELGSPGAT